MQSFYIVYPSLLLVVIVALSAASQALYYCNFDNSTHLDNCFAAYSTSVVASQGLINSSPKAPLSDVTSISKPTENGHVCRLPYTIGANEIYYCYIGTCETVYNGEMSECARGKYAHFTLSGNNVRTVQLKIPAGSITTVGQQCLTYYYHMSTLNGDTLSVRKGESNGVIDEIDHVTSIPMNAWKQRQVSFNAIAPDYTISFDMQATSGLSSPSVSLDEISIIEGQCDNPSVTGSSTPFVSSSSPLIRTTTTTSSSSSSSASTTIQSVTTTTTKPMSTVVTTTTTKPISTVVTTTTTSSSTIASSSPSTFASVSSSTTQRPSSSTYRQTTPSTLNFTTIFQNTTYPEGDDETTGIQAYIIVIAVLVPLAILVTILVVVWLKRPKATISPDQDHRNQDTGGYEMESVPRP